MAIDDGDVKFAFYVLDQAIYTHKPLGPEDCALIKKFIEALLEHKQQPSDNVKSREWRAAVYRKLLDDPQALHQFTEQALQKFGPERLARMVAPQLQEQIVDNHLEAMDVATLVRALKQTNRWTELLEYAFEREEEWVIDHFGLRERFGNAKSDVFFATDPDEEDDDEEDEEDEGYQGDRRYYR